jgi:hypothetical protein
MISVCLQQTRSNTHSEHRQAVRCVLVAKIRSQDMPAYQGHEISAGPIVHSGFNEEQGMKSGHLKVDALTV